MDPRFRFVYMFLGFGAFAMMFVYMISTFLAGSLADIKPEALFLFCLVSILFLFFAYATYPDEADEAA